MPTPKLDPKSPAEPKSASRLVLPLLIALMGLIYIFAVPFEPEALKLTFKLVPMALIFAYAWTRLPKPADRRPWQTLGLIGLVFCAVGDGTLRWFVIGLSAFLIGHLFYLSSFLLRMRFSPLRIAALLPLAAYGIFMGMRLVEALRGSGQTGLIVPVIAYVAVISLMAWSAIQTGDRQAIAGSLLFVASDSILSWNLFVADVPFSHALIMLTYYGAQFLIAGSLSSRGSDAAPALRR
ncbi:lysoplasmalogenase [Paenibacillus pasadenensis]|uniref:Permease of the drug/metabolite transporter (DMT) superfamily n=1 Tax=Paenibacillus pasadenensis TaxID=217090 RepID=A0A2N5N1M7_9BACL|nr:MULTISPECIES: lysoplasmalogenase [Paenibacillus]PLT44240.1 Permease of the drug/metabolite transporter (DMT) superfamily [Paenibacillus pasadenensis]QGG54765.1 lysoplasmalogenase [Paenibacillus sp. B01]